MTLRDRIEREINRVKEDVIYNREQVQEKLRGIFMICSDCAIKGFERCEWGEIAYDLENLLEDIRLYGETYTECYQKQRLLENILREEDIEKEEMKG